MTNINGRITLRGYCHRAITKTLLAFFWASNAALAIDPTLLATKNTTNSQKTSGLASAKRSPGERYLIDSVRIAPNTTEQASVNDKIVPRYSFLFACLGKNLITALDRPSVVTVEKRLP